MIKLNSYVLMRPDKDEPNLWTVGFFDPAGRWIAESDHDTHDQAAERVAWLNGSDRDKMRGLEAQIRELREEVGDLRLALRNHEEVGGHADRGQD